MTLAIEQVSCDSIVQPRAQFNQSVIRDYFELMRAGETFPPLQVVAVDKMFLLIDGYHRFEAAKLAQLESIRCVVHDGDRRHAILLSSSANVRHGLRRTVADKKRAVMKVLSDPEWRQWSDRQIARYCSVSQPFVSGLRSRMRNLTDNVVGDNPVNGEGTQRRFITKHGKPAVMHLAARRQSSTVTGESFQPVTEVPVGGTTEGAVVAVESVEACRARFMEAIVTCEKVVRATDVRTVRTDTAADDELRVQLKTFAQLIESKADMLVRGS